jgi:hypothetical protein
MDTGRGKRRSRLLARGVGRLVRAKVQEGVDGRERIREEPPRHGQPHRLASLRTEMAAFETTPGHLTYALQGVAIGEGFVCVLRAGGIATCWGDAVGSPTSKRAILVRGLNPYPNHLRHEWVRVRARRRRRRALRPYFGATRPYRFSTRRPSDGAGVRGASRLPVTLKWCSRWCSENGAPRSSAS